ncbi:MAG: DUF2007 domain-containing protein [Burkholderiales bacterium]|nr:DUF2007 domain-containing protein [Burkholderiales bacterium]
MKRLCRAANLPEAHILRGLLEQAGIETRVFNEHAQGGVGQLPVQESWPELWVDEQDLVRAAALLDAFQRSAPATGTRTCAACAEDSPSNFQICWNCGAPL